MTMNKLIKLFMAAALLAISHTTLAAAKDDPLLMMLKLDQLELRNGKEDPLVAEGYFWVGRDLGKLWLNFDLERVDGELEELGTQLLYSRAVAPFWDIQVGWGRDHRPSSETRDWLVLGFNGVAPYQFEVDAQLMVGDSGRTAASLNAEYELMFTQKLVLIPEAEVKLFGRDDDARGIGAGLSSASLGLRLAYEIRREFAPYIGVHWGRKFGGTADHARSEGEPVQDTQWVVGIRAWF
jgi:copper resistance protein B